MIEEFEVAPEEPLSDVFDVPENEIELSKDETNALVPVEGEIVSKEEIRANYDKSRTTLLNNIANLEDGMQEALREIGRDPSPRALEVLGNLAKVMTTTASALNNLHTATKPKENKTLNVKGNIDNSKKTMKVSGKQMQKFLDGDLDD